MKAWIRTQSFPAIRHSAVCEDDKGSLALSSHVRSQQGVMGEVASWMAPGNGGAAPDHPLSAEETECPANFLKKLY